MQKPDDDVTMARRVLRLEGSERVAFLQGIVTNDLSRRDRGPVYAALLSAQGKYLADFFVIEDGEALLVDVAAALADDLTRRLGMYKLRADVTVTPTDVPVAQGTGDPPPGAWPDPRSPGLGWRSYGDAARGTLSADAWTALRVAHIVPESGIELVPNDSYILEMGFERLNGVDFRKGCYVGQEVTARMKHKTELRKGLAQVAVEGAAPVGTAIVTEDGKPAGTLYSQADGLGLAYLRYDRAEGTLQAGEARVTFRTRG